MEMGGAVQEVVQKFLWRREVVLLSCALCSALQEKRIFNLLQFSYCIIRFIAKS